MASNIMLKIEMKSLYNDMLENGASNETLHKVFNIIVDSGFYAIFDIETGDIIEICDNKTDFMEKCNKYYEKMKIETI